MTEPLPCRRCGKVPEIAIGSCRSANGRDMVAYCSSNCQCVVGLVLPECSPNESNSWLRQRFIEKYNEQQKGVASGTVD
jgi:hypothetical protein